MLDVWPPFPIVIASLPSEESDDGDYRIQNVDNIVAALEHRNRVRQIHISDISSSGLEKVWAAMQEPFPELISLALSSGEKTMAVLPDSFSGGFPRLQEVEFHGIPFPGLPKLLLSATHLTELFLYDIPHSGYFSPEEIATALSTLTSLDHLYLGFQSPLSLPDRASRRPRPPKRFVLHVLTKLGFKGVGEYLEDLMDRIDVPLLRLLGITFFNQILFDTPRLIQFINRTSALKAPEKARVNFWDGTARVELSSRRASDCFGDLSIEILCEKSDWQVSSLEQVCISCLPPLSTVEDLYISEYSHEESNWQGNIENVLWLELLQPFTAVKNLYLSEEFVPRVMPSLQELVGERTTEVLPNLQNIFLEELEKSGPVQEGIWQFAAIRRVTSHPVTLYLWEDPWIGKT
jgi:hypothetical protein